MKKVLSLLCVSVLLISVSTSYAMSADVDSDAKVVFVEPTADLTAHINLLVDVSTKTIVYKAPLEMSTSLVNAYEGELVEGVPQVATMGVTYTKEKTLNNTIHWHLDNHDRRLVNETYTNVDNTYKDVPLVIPLGK